MPQGMPRGHLTRAIQHIKERVAFCAAEYMPRIGACGMKATYEEPPGILECLRDPFLEGQQS
jgi:hypothetical protein